MNKDTICAIATGHGGALGIVRVSGDKALQITDSIFKAANKQSLITAMGNTLLYGQIEEANGETIDDVLVSVFKAPHSYTGENATEISCHNSPYILQRVMLRLVENGARLDTSSALLSKFNSTCQRAPGLQAMRKSARSSGQFICNKT